MTYELSSGELAAEMAKTGVKLSPSTIQRYAREGRIPSRLSPGGRYRYNLTEVHTALTTAPATQTLTAVPLAGGLGTGEAVQVSESDRLRTAVRAHQTDPRAGVSVAGHTPAPVHDQLSNATTRMLAFA
jgi:hypothetical protein